MKEFIRSIDDLGRVVIPMELRRGFGIKVGDLMNIHAVPAGILLSPLNASCVICGSTEDLLQIRRDRRMPGLRRQNIGGKQA